ncbi:hypothetical protein FRC03_003958 [Tulasnella sp. 419]|nr:hypothetical protein FRC03_003958 [Tulasnella sp. 419]
MEVVSSPVSDQLESAPSNLDHYPDVWNAYIIDPESEGSKLIVNFAGDLDSLLTFSSIHSSSPSMPLHLHGVNRGDWGTVESTQIAFC